MYEIWLGLNIVYEMVLASRLWVVSGVMLWMALVALVLMRGGARWRVSLPAAVFAAALAAVCSVFALSALTGSGLWAMGYWVDWMLLFALAGAAGVLAFAFFWPCAAGLIRTPR